jgi:hypothetical protein
MLELDQRSDTDLPVIYVPDGGSVNCTLDGGVITVPACILSWDILDAQVLEGAEDA